MKPRECPFCGSLEADWGDHLSSCYLKMMDDEQKEIKAYSVVQFLDAWNTRASARNTEYTKCNKCNDRGFICEGAGQCDHDGKECDASSNCGEYEPMTCPDCLINNHFA